MKIKILLLSVITSLSVNSCSTKKNNQDDWDKENIRSLDIDDPKVKRAMKAAQDSLGFYADYFKKYNGQKDYRFYLKRTFKDQEEIEHMWSRPISLTDNGFESIIDNQPSTLTNYKLGDTVLIRFADIEDFIIVTADSAVIGHYLQKEFGD